MLMELAAINFEPIVAMEVGRWLLLMAGEPASGLWKIFCLDVVARKSATWQL